MKSDGMQTGRYDLEKLKSEAEEIQKVVESRIGDTKDLDPSERVKHVENILREAGEGFKQERRVKKPWISESTWKLVTERSKLKVKKRQNLVSEEEYKEACKQVKKSSRADRRKWMNEKCEEIEQCFGGN